MGYKSEVLVQGSWSTNGVVWPDEASARDAGVDLSFRWMLVEDVRVKEVAEEPNRPTWDEYVAKNGYPRKSVQL